MRAIAQFIDVRSTAADPFSFSVRRYMDSGGQNTDYSVHRCVCVSVDMCVSVSRGVSECILDAKIVTFGYPRGFQNRARTQ